MSRIGTATLSDSGFVEGRNISALVGFVCGGNIFPVPRHSGMKRVRLLDDETQPAGSETADRCWFWSGEQNRWVNVISDWIMEHDPFASTVTIAGRLHDRGFAIVVQGDRCMPVTMEPKLKIRIGPDSGRVAVKITMPCILWGELSNGWDMFARQVRKAVFLRCGLMSSCPEDGDPTTRKPCLVCKASWACMIFCGVKKVPVAEQKAK